MRQIGYEFGAMIHMKIRALAARLVVGILALTLAVTAAPALAVKAGSQVFIGLVRHVSTGNIKVYNPRTHQTLSFALVPRFNNIRSRTGSTTQQMSALRPGQYVKVYYDQKFFGQKHADRIIMLNSMDDRFGAERG